MRTTREKMWMCSSCGYVMDAATNVTGGDEAPKEGDVTLCLECAAVYERRAGAWAPATAAKVVTWPTDVRQQIVLLTAQIMTLRRRERGGARSRPAAAGTG